MEPKSIILYVALILTFSNCNEREKVLLYEDFSSNTLNTDLWNYELGDGCPNLCGWGNNERQIYTKQNVSLRDGNLVITATKDSLSYTSGRITTKDKFEFQHGIIEARMKLPEGQGLWPAFWMLGSNIDEVGWPKCGEIDIMEYVGKNPHEIHTTLHTADSYGNSKNTKITTVDSIEQGFHTYKAKWTEDIITFYIDGKEVYVFSPNPKDENIWPFDQSFYVILNLAIGGNFGGPEVDDSIFPREFIIDYIKVTTL